MPQVELSSSFFFLAEVILVMQYTMEESNIQPRVKIGSARGLVSGCFTEVKLDGQAGDRSPESH